MNLSNKNKDATTSSTETTQQTTNTIQSSELINEIAENTHLSAIDSFSAFSMIINSIKTHLLEGDNINLGDLGILSICNPKGENNKSTQINFTPSKHLTYEFQEKERLLSNCKNDLKEEKTTT